jgi:uncharacterized protein (DUF58 family)
MPAPRPEALLLARRYRLGLDETPPRGPAGERLGLGTGASLEFQDRRAYAPGDDVRHVDWRALARTDQLLVRQWREEVLPRVEVLLDGSRSMAIEPLKAQLAADLAALLGRAAAEDGAQVRVVVLGEPPRLLPLDELEREGLDFAGSASLLDSLRIASALQRPGSTVILVSDFLSPHAAGDLVRPLAARAGALALLQVLAPEESEPAAGRANRLVDCESGATLDLVLDAPTVARYRRRLRRLCDELEVEARRARGRFVQLGSRDALDVACRERLAREGVLVPR